MCGICGFIGKGSSGILKKMLDTMTHRGPDEEGIYENSKEQVFLGHKRLSILDIEGGGQPMITCERDFVIIFNGEIYNYIELRAELQSLGCLFQSNHSDTEVLLLGYKIWGKRLPEKLNGMWAFAIYDKKKQEIFISRDRFGKKPLFYTQVVDDFIFSSELSSLRRHPKCPNEYSEKSLIKYFAHQFIPSPNSILKNVYKLPAGHNLIYNIKKKSYKIEKFWDFVLEPFSKISKKPEEEWGEEINRLLNLAVKRRLVADVPVGVFLSGGIDSSAIAYYCAENKPNIKSFSIGFDEASFDESIYSKKMANLLKTTHLHKKFSVEKALEIIPNVLSMLDEPMGDSSILPTYLLAQMTREHVTVALSGDGGDELFAGYSPFHALKLAKLYEKFIPQGIHLVIKKLINMLPVSHNYMSLDFKLKKTLSGFDLPWSARNGLWLSTLEFHELENLFGKKLDPEDVYSEAISSWNECPQENLIDKTLQFFTKTYLQDNILVKADRATMMHSLEARSPFLDIDFVNFVRHIPANYKYRNGTTKFILKKALEQILPHDILYRKKQGFGVPIGKWFYENKIIIDKATSKKLNKTVLNNLLNKHISRQNDYKLLLWNTKVLSAFSI